MRAVLWFALSAVMAGVAVAPAWGGPEAQKPSAEKAASPEAKPAEAKPAEKKDADKKDNGKPDAKPADAKSAPKKDDKKPEPKKKVSVVRFTLRGGLPEGPAAPGLFGDLQTSLASTIERMDHAATDKKVDAVWLRIEDADLGRAKVEELRAAVARLRKAGKPVYAEMTSAEAPQYLLAAACDKIVMPPSGMLVLPGVRAEVTFYKGLLDKLGIEFDMLQMGKFKGAAEPMTRTGMSDAMRENMNTLIDGVFENLVATVAADRKLKDYRVQTLIDEGLFTAPAAQRAGLIDQVHYADQLQESLRKLLKGDEIEVVTNYKKKQVDVDFSGIGGFMKLMEMMMGGKPAEKPGKLKKIAVIYAVGPIVEGKSASDLFGESAVGSATLVATLKKAADDPKVAAIVLRIDSPGGSAIASDLIWRETVRIEKPIIASMGDVAASGGYYIAMGADKVFAAPGTITGSIGVVGGKVVFKGLYDKLGLTTEVISRGEKAGSFSSAAPFTPEERKAWTALMQDTYRQFVDKAAQGRKLPRQKVEELAQGRVYTGRQALANGLVDQLGTLRDAIAAAKQAAGLKADEEVEIQTLPKPQGIFEQLFGDADLSGELDMALPDALKLLRRTKLYRRLLSEPTLLWMPYDLRLK